MKPFTSLLTLLILVSVLGTNLAADGPSKGRKLGELNVIPPRVLQRCISPKFYKTLLVSPVEGWIVVRASLVGTRLSGIRLVRSELNGAYDSLALKLANEMLIAGNYTIDRPNVGSSILLHLLIYQIADGTMALSFAHLDEPGGDQADYYGCARLAVLKADGKWTEIKGPEGLEGKGWAIRRGFKNNLDATLRMEIKKLGSGM
ncbi:MAG: hypothetical protein QOF24_833 [Verrucomicrobiota bacterium]|jgi:hypothetical protein